MIKTYNVNIDVFEGKENGRIAHINTEPAYLELYDDADDFIEDVKEKYPWISEEDLEHIWIAVAGRF